MQYAILTDLTRCIGCEACVMACREINGLPRNADTGRLTAANWTALEQRSKVNVRRQCMHCIDPACVSVCPVAALQKTAEGPVIYLEDHCMGCRYCVMACPFEIPKYEWGAVLPKVQKCIMCYDKRVSKGEQPACTAACPAGATIFGEREELLKVARQRIDSNNELYVDRIYGQFEAGGTSVLYLSDVPFEELGFKSARMDTYPILTWRILSQIPKIVSVGGVTMFGIWWIINRRITLEKIRNGELTEEEAFPEKV